MTDMTVADVARACGVTERTVRRWLREGRLPAMRVGGRVRIPDHAVRELAAPYAAPGSDPSPARGDVEAWWASLQDPARLVAVDQRRIARAVSLMDMVRGMSGPAGRAGPGASDLVREGRDEQDARWDEPLG